MPERQRNVGRGRSISDHNQLPPEPVQHNSDHQLNGFNTGHGRGSGRSNSSLNQLPPPQPVQHSSDHQLNRFNRGFGRGRERSNSSQNQLPPPQPEQHRSSVDSVLMEAGRLATEYLVSRGVLPHNVLSSERQNSNIRNQAGEFQSSRSREAAQVDISAPVVDTRTYLVGSSSAGSGNNLEQRRSHGYDLDFRRSRSWSERSNAFGDDVAEDIADESSNVDLARMKRSHSH